MYANGECKKDSARQWYAFTIQSVANAACHFWYLKKIKEDEFFLKMFKKLEYSQITHSLQIVGVYICSNTHKQLPKINAHKFFTSLLSVRKSSQISYPVQLQWITMLKTPLQTLN